MDWTVSNAGWGALNQSPDCGKVASTVMPMAGDGENRDRAVLRGFAVVVLVVCGVFAAWAWGRSGALEEAREVEMVNEALQDPELVWVREKLHYGGHEMLRRPCPQCPDGVLLGDRTGLATYTNPARIRVLAVSDSYAVGAYLPDLDARWWVQLEDALDAATTEGTFEVVGIGRSGASGYSYAAWVEAIAAGDFSLFANDDTGVLRGDFDAIVIGHVGNDAIPGEADGEAAPRPVGPAGSTDWTTYERVPARIAGAARGAALYLAPLYKGRDDARIERIYREHGFHVVAMDRSDTMQRRHDLRDLIVLPVDGHPSGAVYRAHAEDIAAAMLTTLDRGRLDAATLAARPAVRPFIASYMPTTLEAEMDGGGRYATIRWTGRVGSHPCLYAGAEDVGGMLECGKYFVRGARVPTQHTPCAAMGRPYVQIMLDRAYDGNVTVAMPEADGTEYEVYGYGYDLEGFSQIARIGTLRPGGEIDFNTNETLRGVLVAEAGRVGCEWGDESDGVIAPFTLRFERSAG